MNETKERVAERLHDPVVWSIWLLGVRVLQKAKSRLLALLFRAPGLYLGRGSVVRGVHHVSFGRDVYAHGNLWLEAVSCYRGQIFQPQITIGDRVSFSDGVHVTCIDRIVLGNDILFGSRVYISDHNHGAYKGLVQSNPSDAPTTRDLGGGGPVIIEDNVWIGDNAVLVGPLFVGEGAIVGANSVVTRDVPARTIVAGVPARPIKRFNQQTATWDPIRDA